MNFEIKSGPAVRFRKLAARFGDGYGEKTILAMMDLTERALALMDRQGPEKVVLRAGTPGKGRKVVEIPIAEIFGIE